MKVAPPDQHFRRFQSRAVVGGHGKPIGTGTHDCHQFPPLKVRQGAVDYFIHDAPTIWRLGMDPSDDELFGLYHPLTDERLAWAVARDDEALAERLNALVRQWTASGEIDAILTRWVPVRVTQ